MAKGERELLFRLTKKDFEINDIRGSGSGGQHRNKKATGVRIKHPASGAVGQATDSKSHKINRRNAFRRLVDSEKFKIWHRMEVGRHLISETEVQKWVNRMMAPRHLRVETRQEDGWVEEEAGPTGEGKEETSPVREPPNLDRLT